MLCWVLVVIEIGIIMYLKKKRTMTPWVVGVLVASVVLWLLYALNDIMAPFIIAAVLAYILNPLVEKLRNYKVKRGLAAMLVMFLALLILLALVLIIVPMLVGQFNNILSRVPQIIGFMQDTAIPWLNKYLGMHISVNSETVTTWLQSHTGSLKDAVQKIAPTLMKQSGSVVVIATNMVLLPFLLYYFLLDWQRWSHGIKALVPRRFIDTFNRITLNMDSVLGEFLRGQLMVMLIMGVIYGTGLMLTGLDSGFAIGMIAGILVFVPYLGAFTGLLLATLAGALQFGSWNGMLMVWGVFAIGQFLESFLITPKIVGDRIGLSPFWVIFSLMAFGQLMGFVGMLVGLPLAAVSLVLLREGSEVYFNSRFYKQRSDS